MKLFVYFYEGIKEVLSFILSILKYFIIGVKWFPTALAHMISNMNYKNKKKEKEKKGDQLLIEAKKNAHQKEIIEQKARSKKVEISQRRSKRKIESYASNSENLLNKQNKKLEKKYKKQNLTELVLDSSTDDATKTEEKMVYKYLARDKNGVLTEGYFNAFSKVEVFSYLKSEGFTVYKIETNFWINFSHKGDFINNYKFKNKDLIFFISMLSTYLKAGITLADACKILSRQIKNKKQKKILNDIIYDLSIGFSFSEAMERRGKSFPSILINMVKTAEMTGELPDTLDDMEEYFTEIEATRKAMVTAMMYPAIIFVIAIGVGTFIMLYVVPKFVAIYETMDDAQIPLITTIVLGLSEFLQKYILYLAVLSLILIFILIYIYRNVKSIRTVMQHFAMRIPVFGNIIIYNEVTNFTKTFSSLLAHNVYITDSMEILNQITNNEIYKEMIYDSIVNISKGKSVSLAFKDRWEFPVPAYEMIVTGEKTGQLPEMMRKVSNYYQDLHRNSVTRIKTFIEPVLIIMLTAMVGVIVLSIVVPMFSMYSQIQA